MIKFTAQRRLSLMLAVLAWPAFVWSAPAGERVTLAGSLAPQPNVAGTKAASTSRLVASAVTPLSAEQLATPMEFSVALGMRNLEEFQARVGSGELVPYEEVQAKYLPLQSDYDRVAAWLKSEGFTFTFDDTSRLSLFVQGTPAQIQSSFGLTMQSVIVNGIAYTAATTAPSLPAGVSSGVLGVNGLQPYIQKHTYHVRPATALATSAKASPAKGAQPNSNASANNPPFLIGEILNAFNGGTLTTTVGGTTTVLDGTGQKIAILIDALALHTDLTTFWTNNKVSQNINNIEEVNVPGGTTTNREVEETLDEEWSSGVASGAKVRVYCSNSLTNTNLNKCLAQIQKDVTGATAAAIAQPQLHAMSMSYGEDLTGVSTSEYSTESGYYATIANGNTFYGGVSIFASSGDDGSQPDHPTTTLIVSYPAADASITGVGGTDLYYSSTLVNGRNWTEKGWGEYTKLTLNGESYSGYGGSGGGASTSKIARPSWQVGTGVPSGTTRLVPDVAAPGGPTVCDIEYSGSDTWEFGTSWSSPTWAGFSALLNQARALNGRLPLGSLNRRVYPLIGSGAFYDITTGNNSYTSSTTNGATGTGSYSCTTGYDEVTGVGTPNLAVLVSALSGPTITSFSPTGGAVGTSVVITGTNFYTSTANPLTVSFNGTTATSATVNSSTQITAIVPSNFTAGPITVTSIGDATTSAASFTAPAPDAGVVTNNLGTVSQGDNGDVFTLSVSNAGSQATSGTTTVTVYPGTGLYIASVIGTSWSCAASADGSYWTCTYANSVAAGSPFPALTTAVNVSPSAPTTVNNGSLTAHVTTAGDSNSANDTSTVQFTIKAAATTPTQGWRYQYFHTTADSGNAADTANPAGDGINNLTKYALGLDPTMAETNPITQDTSTGYLQLTVPRNPNATDITYSVQVTGDLTTPTSWTTSGTSIIQNTSTVLQVRDTVPVGSTPERFIRLQVSR